MYIAYVPLNLKEKSRINKQKSACRPSYTFYVSKVRVKTHSGHKYLKTAGRQTDVLADFYVPGLKKRVLPALVLSGSEGRTDHDPVRLTPPAQGHLASRLATSSDLAQDRLGKDLSLIHI